MDKKNGAWHVLAFLAAACLAVEQLAVLFAGHSSLLEKIYLVTGLVSAPAIMFVVGFFTAKRKKPVKDTLFFGYTLIAAVVLTLVLKLIWHIDITLETMLNEKVLVLLAYIFVFVLLSGVMRHINKAVLPALSFVIAAVCFLPSLPWAVQGFGSALFFFVLGFVLPIEKTENIIKKSGVAAASAIILLAYGAAAFFRFDSMKGTAYLGLREFYGSSFDAAPVMLVLAGAAFLLIMAVIVMAGLSVCGFVSPLFYDRGDRCVSAMLAVVMFRQIVLQGWWMDILQTVSAEHWILLYSLIALACVFIAVSWCMDVFVNLILWPVGRYHGQAGKIATVIKNSRKYRYLLRELIKKGIVLKYRRSFFGILWSLFEPLLTMMVLTYVFSNFFGHNDPFYPVYILTGRLLFNLFQTTTGQALRSVRANASMIKKVYVPKYMYPLSSILYNFVLFLISLIDLVLVMLYYHVPFTLRLFETVLPIAVLLAFSVGIGMILATINVFFRDIEYLWNVFCLLLMYCSAIFYKPTSLAGTSAEWVLKANPVYLMIYNFRRLVIDGAGPDWSTMLYSMLVSVITLFVGFAVFYKKQDEFILHI